MHQLSILHHIKVRREELQVTQEVLAELSGVGLRTLKGIESGKANPTLETLLKILDVLGLEIQLGVKEI